MASRLTAHYGRAAPGVDLRLTPDSVRTDGGRVKLVVGAEVGALLAVADGAALIRRTDRDVHVVAGLAVDDPGNRDRYLPGWLLLLDESTTWPSIVDDANAGHPLSDGLRSVDVGAVEGVDVVAFLLLVIGQLLEGLVLPGDLPPLLGRPGLADLLCVLEAFAHWPRLALADGESLVPDLLDVAAIGQGDGVALPLHDNLALGVVLGRALPVPDGVAVLLTLGSLRAAILVLHPATLLGHLARTRTPSAAAHPTTATSVRGAGSTGPRSAAISIGRPRRATPSSAAIIVRWTRSSSARITIWRSRVRSGVILGVGLGVGVGLGLRIRLGLAASQDEKDANREKRLKSTETLFCPDFTDFFSLTKTAFFLRSMMMAVIGDVVRSPPDSGA